MVSERYRPAVRLSLLILLFCVLSSAALAAGMPVRRIAAGDIPNEYIVGLQNVAPADVDTAAREIAAKVDGQVVTVWKHAVTAFWVRVPSERANRMFRDPRVKSIEQNARMHQSGAQNTATGRVQNPGDTCDVPGASCDPAGEFTGTTVTPHVFWHLSRISHRSRTDSEAKKSYNFQSDGTGVDAYMIDGGMLRFHQEFTSSLVPAAGRHTDPAESPRVKEVAGSNVIATRGGPDRLPSSAPNFNCSVAAFESTMPGTSVRYHSQYPWFTPSGVDGGITTHGTSVASVLGGRYVGVAKGVNLIPVKANGCWNTSTTGDFISAAEWILVQEQAKTVSTAALVSISMYRLVPQDSKFEDVLLLEQAIKSLTDYGIPVFASANNWNDDACKTTPARLSRRGGRGHVITVGGLAKGSDTKFQKSPGPGRENGSNWGPCVDIFAPGGNMVPATSNSWSSYYQGPSGTSYSAPAVAGIAARLLSEGAVPVPADLTNLSAKQAFVKAVGDRLIGDATRLPELNGADQSQVLGPGSPNLIAYIGSRHIAQQPRSIDTHTTITNLDVTMPAGTNACRYTWYESPQADYSTDVALKRLDASSYATFPAAVPPVQPDPAPPAQRKARRTWYWVRVQTDCADPEQYVDSALASVSHGCAIVQQQPQSQWPIGSATPDALEFTVQSAETLSASMVTWYRGPRGRADETFRVDGGTYAGAGRFVLNLSSSSAGEYWARIAIGDCITDTDVAQIRRCIPPELKAQSPLTATGNAATNPGVLVLTFSDPAHVANGATVDAYQLLVKEGDGWRLVMSSATASFYISSTGAAKYIIRAGNGCGSDDSKEYDVTPNCINVSSSTFGAPTLLASSVPEGSQVLVGQMSRDLPRAPYAWRKTFLRTGDFEDEPTVTSFLIDTPTKHTLYATKSVSCNETSATSILLIQPRVTLQPNDKSASKKTSMSADAVDVDPPSPQVDPGFQWYRLTASATGKGSLDTATLLADVGGIEGSGTRTVSGIGGGTYYMTATIQQSHDGKSIKAVATTRYATITCIPPSPRRRPSRSSDTIVDPAVPAGSAVNISVDDEHDGTTFYWYAGTVGDLSQPVGPGASRTVNPVTTTTYWALVRSGCDPNLTATSDPITIAVQCDPIVYTQPVSSEQMMGASGTTTRISAGVVAGGGGPFTYRWYTITDGSPTPDPTQTTAVYNWDYIVPNPRPARAERKVQVEILSTCGGSQKVATSVTATLTLLGTSIQSIFAYSSGDTTYGPRRGQLYIVMDPPADTNHQYVYEWFEDGVALAGNGSKMLVDGGTGKTYWARVTGTHALAAGPVSEVTTSKKMYVWEYGSCALPPLEMSQNIYDIPVGSSPDVVFTAVCDWPGTNFQWFQGQRGDTRHPVTADADMPHRLTVGTGSIASYWVRVSLECGVSQDSPTMTYRRGSCGPMLINQNILSVDVAHGGNATLAVDPVVATTTPVYKWFKGDGETDLVQSGSSPALALSNITESARYWVRVMDLPCGTIADSYVATVRVASCGGLTPPVWQTLLWINTGTTVTLQAQTVGATTYHWYRGEVGDTSQEIAGAASATYTTAALTADAKYWVRASNGTCSIDSPTITVRVCVPPQLAGGTTYNVNIVKNQWTVFGSPMSGTDLTYQWYQGLPGDTSHPVGTPIDRLEIWPSATTSYWLRVTGRCGVYDSPVYTASVCPTIQVPTASPASVMPNATATLTMSATGDGLTYQWYSGPRGNTAAQYKVANGTGSTLLTPPITGTTSFWCQVKSGNCPRDSEVVTVRLCSEPTVSWVAGNRNIARGDTVFFSFTTAHSTAQAQVTVYAGNAGDLAGSTVFYGPVASSFNRVVNQTTKFWARAVVGNCSTDTGNITVTVCIPKIATPPVGGNITAGGSHPLSVTADITPVGGYQWYAGETGDISAPVANGTSASISVSPAVDTRYWVRIKGCGSSQEDSAAVLVTVCTPPTVPSQSVSAWLVKGSTRELHLFNVTGTNLTYRWYRGTAGDTTNQIGTSSSVFVNPTNTTSYWGRVSNGCGTADSATIIVSVCATPSITAQPLSQSIFSGRTATLTVTATQATTTPMTYQWYSGATAGSGTAISGATGASFTTPALTASTSYWVEIKAGTNVCSVNSAVATVSMCAYSEVINSPADVDIASGGSATFNMNLSPVPSAYKWYRGAQGDRSNPISASSQPTVTPTSTTQYWAEITHGTCTAMTRTVTVWVSIPTISQQPVNQLVGGNVAAPLSVTAAPAGVAYQWYEGAAGSGTLIPGAISSSYSVPGRIAGTTSSFWVKLTGSRGHVLNSNAATVTWCTPANITREPQDVAIRRGSSAPLSVEADGTNATFQWYRGAAGVETYTAGTGTSINPVPTNTETYWVKVTSSCGGTDNSRTVTVDVCVDPTISVQPLSHSVYSNTSATLTVTASSSTGGTLTYQWYQGTSGSGTLISGATGASYTTLPLTATTNYWVKVTKGACSVQSTTATVGICSYGPTVNGPADMYTSQGKQVLLRAQISPVPVSGKWYRGVQGDRSNLISNQTQHYVYPTATTQYWAELVGSDGCKTMTRTVTVNVCVPRIDTHPASIQILWDTSTTLSVTAVDAVSYQWQRNGSIIPGATSSTYNTGPVRDETYYQVVVTGSCGVSVNSEYATVTTYW